MATSRRTVLTCNKESNIPCIGEVTYWVRPSDFKSFPKCAKHHDEAVTEFDRINDTYGVTSDVAPQWIDPSYAGEQW